MHNPENDLFVYHCSYSRTLDFFNRISTMNELIYANPELQHVSKLIVKD